MKIPIQPLEYKVLIEVAKVEDVTAGGIILPQSARDQQQVAREVGKLVAVSAMAFCDPDWPQVPKVGDSVIYNRYAGSVIRHNGTEFRLMQDKDLGAVVTKDFSEEIK